MIECLDVNKGILERGRKRAEAEGVAAHIVPVAADLNRWQPHGSYDAVLANQSRWDHKNDGSTEINDAVSLYTTRFGGRTPAGTAIRNRAPGVSIVEEFWDTLPPAYRIDRQRNLQEGRFPDTDYSTRGFEGIRAQDILPLLVERFAFDAFVGFANVIDPFVDRSFGPNFSVERDWDRDFIDRVHARDEAALGSGEITPTHMLAVMCVGREGENRFVDGRSPRQSIRRPD